MKRIDLHCHSDASNRPAEAVLGAINCPECYSAPDEVYRQARGRGMDFVTITDHDCIDGVARIAERADVLVGEELTCFFPEDNCKMHVLVYGITPEDHRELQARSRNIYDVAEYVERRSIAHSVAHPIYRQNDKLERWHVERLLLMFKGFECLNGAHSRLHREAFEPLLNGLTEQELTRLGKVHGMTARWPEPWKKARTGGSDDHGLLNIGRTWTEFPEGTHGPADVLYHLRHGNCRPGGEAGSSAKLAHTFYSVAVRYYSRHIVQPGTKPSLAAAILQTLAGERRLPSKTDLAKAALKNKVKKIVRRVTRPMGTPTQGGGTSPGLIRRLFLDSAKKRFVAADGLRKAAEQGLPPLGEHEEVFLLASMINRDVSEGIAAAINKSVDDASFTDLFDAIAAILAQQFVLSPYYFAAFHQNKERHLLRQLTGNHTPKKAGTLKVGLFTDTLEDVNGVARFLHDVLGQAGARGYALTVHTCSPARSAPGEKTGARVNANLRDPEEGGSEAGDGVKRRTPDSAGQDVAGSYENGGWHRFSARVKSFEPLLARALPYYEDLTLNLPPALEVLEWADREQFDVIHVSTPGPMGLCGWLVAKMLRVPMLATYHTDFPAYVEHLTGDHRVTNGCTAYMKWFYGQAATVFTRSNDYKFALRDLGVIDERIATIPPGIDLEKFNPAHRDPSVWAELGVREPRRLLYAGRVSVEKNLPCLVETFRGLCQERGDAALVVAGDGPYLAEMKKALAGLPAYFLGTQGDGMLSRLYASADVFVFPSRTDTLGQVVMEAQASGLPAIVSTDGGPRETVEEGVTGVVMACEARRWVEAIEALLADEPLRKRMATAAAARGQRFSLERTFEVFWAEHLRAVEAGDGQVEAEEKGIERPEAGAPRQEAPRGTGVSADERG